VFLSAGGEPGGFNLLVSSFLQIRPVVFLSVKIVIRLPAGKTPACLAGFTLPGESYCLFSCRKNQG
jgi:hypothetical protein